MSDVASDSWADIRDHIDAHHADDILDILLLDLDRLLLLNVLESGDALPLD